MEPTAADYEAALAEIEGRHHTRVTLPQTAYTDPKTSSAVRTAVAEIRAAVAERVAARERACRALAEESRRQGLDVDLW